MLERIGKVGFEEVASKLGSVRESLDLGVDFGKVQQQQRVAIVVIEHEQIDC